MSQAFVDEGYGEDESLPSRDSNGATEAVREAQLVEDIAALNARLLKEKAFDTGRNAERRNHAQASFDAYHRLYAHKQGDYPASTPPPWR